VVARGVAALLTMKGSHEGCPGNKRAKTDFRNPHWCVGVLLIGATAAAGGH